MQPSLFLLTRRHRIIRPAPISCCKMQKSDVQSDHQNLRVNYDTAVYTSKERLHNQNEVAYFINNNVILFNTEHGFIKNKSIASCSSKILQIAFITGHIDIVKLKKLTM